MSYHQEYSTPLQLKLNLTRTALMSTEWISAHWQGSVLRCHTSSLPLDFLFCSFFKRCQYRQCLILSSFLLLAAFKKEDSSFDEVGWKQVNFRELVTSLAQFQSYTTVLYAVFFTKIIHQGLVGQMLSGRTALQLIFLDENPVVTQCMWCVIYSCVEYGGFPSHLGDAPQGRSPS